MFIIVNYNTGFTNPKKKSTTVVRLVEIHLTPMGFG